MDKNIKIINAVSVTFEYQNNLINHSGIYFNDFVITTGDKLLSPSISDGLPNDDELRITVNLRKGSQTVSHSGFIAYILDSEKIKNSIIRNGLQFAFKSGTFAKFLIIKLKNPVEKQCFDIKFTKNKRKLYNGLEIITVYTPLGNPIFYNCFTKGIISSIPDEEIFLTDTRLLRGCEGAPVYQQYKGYLVLIGMVLCPIMLSEEYSGFNLCCDIFSINEIYNILKTFPNRSLVNFCEANKELTIHCISDVVLPIETSTSKGSGIVLNNSGFIITCGHVINYNVNENVFIRHAGKIFKATILCCSSKNDLFDVAFLQINPSMSLPASRYFDLYPKEGNPVYMIGYEKMNNHFIKMVTKGTLLKHEEKGPVYTSCLTHSGNSGGGIFGEDGKLLAMVCGIVLESKNNQLHHCLSVGIPFKFFLPSLHLYDVSKDNAHLESLCKMGNFLSSKWELFYKSKL